MELCRRLDDRVELQASAGCFQESLDQRIGLGRTLLHSPASDYRGAVVRLAGIPKPAREGVDPSSDNPKRRNDARQGNQEPLRNCPLVQKAFPSA